MVQLGWGQDYRWTGTRGWIEWVREVRGGLQNSSLVDLFEVNDTGVLL